jgi:exopolysaccharide production protein ExoY
MPSDVPVQSAIADPVPHLGAQQGALRMGRFSLAAKRLTDIVLSLVCLALFSPLFLACAILIRRSGPGIFYSDKRVGRDGQVFFCHKFRTMVPNANAHLAGLLAKDPVLRQEWETSFKLKVDPRVTAIGRFLRKTSLDELPQLLNVLKGEMSLVGPRPMFVEEQERWGVAIHDYYSVRPGMTGAWQIYGRSDTDYETRIRLNVEYVRRWSYWGDIVLLAVTPRVFFVRSGAY